MEGSEKKGAHQGTAPERMKGSKKKGDHKAPALLTTIWPQRGERDARGHDESHAARLGCRLFVRERTLVSRCVPGLPPGVNSGWVTGPLQNGGLSTAVRDLERTNVHEVDVLN